MKKIGDRLKNLKKTWSFILFIFVFSFLITGCIKHDNSISNEFGSTQAERNVGKVRTLKEYHRDIENKVDSFVKNKKWDRSEPVSAKHLTAEQRIEDYRSLLKIIQENYPFFGEYERQTGENWYDKFKQKESEIKQEMTDEQFYQKLSEALKDLNSYHAKMCGTEEVGMILEHYSYYLTVPSIRWEYTILNESTVRNRYGLQPQQPHDSASNIPTQEKSLDNLKVNDLQEGKIAYIKVSRMTDTSAIFNDKKRLAKYLEKVRNYPALVIDIRGNPGGVPQYWTDFLLPMIVDKTYRTQNWLFLKQTEETKLQIEELRDNLYPMLSFRSAKEQLDTHFEHEEDLKKFDYFLIDPQTVQPSPESIHFRGKIYLWVDERTYSAAESMAAFCKYSNLATLVGRQTGGDGISLGLIYRALPNSGFVFSYTNVLGFTPDGKMNAFEGTTPNIVTDQPEKATRDHLNEK